MSMACLAAICPNRMFMNIVMCEPMVSMFNNPADCQRYIQCNVTPYENQGGLVELLAQSLPWSPESLCEILRIIMVSRSPNFPLVLLHCTKSELLAVRDELRRLGHPDFRIDSIIQWDDNTVQRYPNADTPIPAPLLATAIVAERNPLKGLAENFPSTHPVPQSTTGAVELDMRPETREDYINTSYKLEPEKAPGGFLSTVVNTSAVFDTSGVYTDMDDVAHAALRNLSGV